MICHKLYLIACFRSDVNVTFVLFDNLRLKIWMFISTEKQTESIDSLVSVQAENNKNVWKLLFSSTLFLMRFYFDVSIFFKQSLHAHYARLGRNLFVIYEMH